MKIIKTDLKNLKEIIKLIKKGKVIICPTDTVYGLICNARNEKAVEKFFKIKKREKTKPIGIFVKDIKMAKEIAEIDADQEKLFKKYLPGKITFILPKKQYETRTRINFLSGLVGAKGTIGIRIPDYPLMHSLFKEINFPLAQTSANISGQPATTKIKEVLKQFEIKNSHGCIRIPRGQRPRVALFACPDLVLDAGNLKKAIPSTVVDLTGKIPKTLRKGEIKISREMFS